jgi:hypothetical protein
MPLYLRGIFASPPEIFPFCALSGRWFYIIIWLPFVLFVFFVGRSSLRPPPVSHHYFVLFVFFRRQIFLLPQNTNHQF